MKYSRFELLAIVVVTCAAVVTLFTTASTTNVVTDVVGQLMIVVALAGGLHWGRKGALVSFLVATGTYAIFAFGFRGSVDLASATQIFLLRTGIYAVVAILGGELNVRLKYLFMKLEHQDFVDDITSLYNDVYLVKLIEKHMDSFDRHGTRFSVVNFTVNPELMKPIKKRVRTRLVKELGNSVVRGNIRTADEAARLTDARFSVLFPNTDREGAACATNRVEGKIISFLHRQGFQTGDEGTVLTEIMEYPGNRDSLEVFVAGLQEVDRA